MITFPDDESVMRRALELARQGEGSVEPNPPVGAVIVDRGRRLLGEGWHRQFGGPHAEIDALQNASETAPGATLFVTLEPCCHTGKTPPCTDAVIASGIRGVVIGALDPADHGQGRGVDRLRNAGIQVESGLLAEECDRLIAPFRKRTTRGLPWVHAKWAMSLDGRIATRSGHSQWISNERSRAVAHELRRRMDAILVGARTAEVDNPRLTARPPGPRTAARIVLDTHAGLELDSALVQTAHEVPVIVACLPHAPQENLARLQAAGVQILTVPAAEGRLDLAELLAELGRRQMTHILVEGGSELLGAFFDAGLVDEIHVFIAPKFIGGAAAIPAIGGSGCDLVPDRPQLSRQSVCELDGDLYLHGDVVHAAPISPCHGEK